MRTSQQHLQSLLDQVNTWLMRKEMTNFLYGILCGIRADRDIIFS